MTWRVTLELADEGYARAFVAEAKAHSVFEFIVVSIEPTPASVRPKSDEITIRCLLCGAQGTPSTIEHTGACTTLHALGMRHNPTSTEGRSNT